MAGTDVFLIVLRFFCQLGIFAVLEQLLVLKHEPNQTAGEKSLCHALLLVQHGGVQDVILVRAPAVIGTALNLAVIEHTIRQVVDAAVRQELERQQVIVDWHAAGIRVDTLQSQVAEHQSVGVNVEKAPIFFGRQAARPDGLFDGLGLAGAFPIVAAVMAAGHILVGGVRIQNVHLLLQFIRVGVKIVAVQVTDILALCLAEEAAADVVHPLDARCGLVFHILVTVHHKNAHNVGIFFFPRPQFCHCIIRRPIVRADHLKRKVGFLRQHGLHSFIHKRRQIVK